jgi:hypothetical protein
MKRTPNEKRVYDGIPQQKKKKTPRAAHGAVWMKTIKEDSRQMLFLDCFITRKFCAVQEGKVFLNRVRCVFYKKAMVHM